MPQNIFERIQTARNSNYSDDQIFNALLNSTLSPRLEKAQAAGFSSTQVLDTLSRGPRTSAISQPKKVGAFRTFFKEEIGAVGTLVSPFFRKGFRELQAQQEESRTRVLRTLRVTPPGPKRERLLSFVRGELVSPKGVNFATVDPTAAKSTSQAVGEAILLGLTAVPGSGFALKQFGKQFGKLLGRKVVTEVAEKVIKEEVKQLTKMRFVRTGLKNFAKGGVVGTSFGAAYGVAQEGELIDKAPTIAFMAGAGFLGGGILTGVLPPAVVLGGKALKTIFRKVFKETQENIIFPSIRYFERRTAGTAGEKIFPITLRNHIRTFTKETVRLERKITKLYDQLSKNMGQRLSLSIEEGLAPTTLLKRKLQRIPTRKSVEKQITQLEKRIDSLEKSKEKVYQERIASVIKAGDSIYDKEVGSISIKQTGIDDQGRVFLFGEDSSGRVVTLLPQDLTKMRKVIPGKLVEAHEILNLPAKLEEKVKLKGFSKVLDSMRGFLQSTSPMLHAMGESGKVMAQMLDQLIDVIARKVGERKNVLRSVILKHGFNKKATALTAKEGKQIVDIMDSGLKFQARTLEEIPEYIALRNKGLINQRVDDYLRAATQVILEISDESVSLGTYIRERGTRRKRKIAEAYIHFPHIPKDLELFEKNAPELVELMQKRMERMTPQKANRLKNIFVDNFGTRRYAGLEQARTFPINGYDELKKFGYEVDPIAAIDNFIVGATKRLEETKLLGKELEILDNLINTIGIDGFDQGAARQLLNLYKGDVAAGRAAEISAGVRGVQTVLKLPLVAIVNTTQFGNIAAKLGITTTAKAFKFYMKNRLKAEEFSLLSGVGDEMIAEVIRVAAGGEKEFATLFLRKVGFVQVERFNRILATVSGRMWAKDTALPALLKNPTDAKYIRHLKRMGIDDVQEVIERGSFTEEQLRIIGQKVVNQTQFRYSVLDIPLYWQSPVGKVLTQYKSFAWQQGTFIKREIVDELGNGNFAPLITYLMVSQITGEAVRDVRDVLRGDFNFRKDRTALERAIENQLSVGGFSLAGDLFWLMFQRGAQGKQYVTAADFIGGPTFSDAFNLVDAVADTLGGRFQEVSGFASRQAAAVALFSQVRGVPGAGAILAILGGIYRTWSRQ